LLQLTFHLSGSGDDFWDKVGPIKDSFLGFQPRSDRLTVTRHTSRATGDPNSMEFTAFTKSSDRDSIFIRDVYFSRSPTDRALILVHEYVHLRNPMNPGNGHPGGIVIMFDKEGDVGIDYDDAIKNPYCYQFRRMVGLTPTSTTILPVCVNYLLCSCGQRANAHVIATAYQKRRS
jgi:hypothetical protein